MHFKLWRIGKLITLDASNYHIVTPSFTLHISVTLYPDHIVHTYRIFDPLLSHITLLQFSDVSLSLSLENFDRTFRNHVYLIRNGVYFSSHTIHLFKPITSLKPVISTNANFITLDLECYPVDG